MALILSTRIGISIAAQHQQPGGRQSNEDKLERITLRSDYKETLLSISTPSCFFANLFLLSRVQFSRLSYLLLFGILFFLFDETAKSTVLCAESLYFGRQSYIITDLHILQIGLVKLHYIIKRLLTLKQKLHILMETYSRIMAGTDQ